jgi:excisionase family DNA binding protein
MSEIILTTKAELQAIVKEAMQTPTATEQPSKKLYTKAEAMQLLRTTMPTIDRWSKEGTLRRITVGNRVYFNANEVDRLIG